MAGSPSHSVDLSQAMIIAPSSPSDWLIISPIIITILAGAIMVMLRSKPNIHAYLATIAMAMVVTCELLLLQNVLEQGPQSMTMGRWMPPFGISFTVDAMGALLAAVSGIVALAVCIYSSLDINYTGRRLGFYPFLMLLMTGVSGSFLTGDIFNLYVWFEVMLISSFGLIILGGERAQIDGALKYAILNLMATTLFLVATGLLYGVTGTLNMADIALKTTLLPPGAPMGTIGALYFLAFAMKAAAFPVNFWLPASYHTPRIVVSAVFAGLLTKVGVYALIRTLVMILPESREQLSEIMAIVAALTMLVGTLGALAQNDVRRILGYLVIAGIGSMLAGVAIGTGTAIMGSILYAVHSILVMTALYLSLGVLIRMSGGKYSLAELGGGYKASSLLSILFLVLVFAVSGLPPFSGFWPKFVLVEAALSEGHHWLTFAILISGLLTSIAMGRVWAHAFWRGGPIGTEDGRDAAPLNNLVGTVRARAFIPISVLTVFVVIMGVMPTPFFGMAQAGSYSLLRPQAYTQAVFGEVIKQKQEQHKIMNKEAESKNEVDKKEEGSH
ncbi:Na+/H+ antiporter subunit D [Cohaesibacter gelatinilyticus]|uniref:Multicomponent Na+:H+ antiporter subunit D n=1 Tax=Cohaesibacter gelatinilyticus TaxID=372072 RepID=A0A285NDW1_9HYPH|nr:Na+/H+ antiporter subunit D [Cohaesibacter gelatinilyticus]SNZ07083.1 multicomponent Na+:H+ antiporter subunit D [Cohaesibacter gelatinilyticus]